MFPGLFLNDLERELRGLLQVAGVIALIWGLVNALFGYKIFRVVLAIAGFIVGAIIGAIIPLLLASSDNRSSALGILFLLLPLAGGIIGAVLAIALHHVGVFFAVGFMGFLLFFLLTESWAAALVLGIVCGIIGAILEKYAIIISTALSGGSLAASGIGMISGGLGHGATVVIGLILGICGIVFQLWMEQKKPTAAPAAQPKAAVPASQPNAAVPVPPPIVPPAPRAASAVGGYCGRCGAKMSGSANFCPKCGASRNT